MGLSKLDKFYRRLLISRFFEKGWGKPENLQRLFKFRKVLSQRQTCFSLVPNDYPVEIVKEVRYANYTMLDGKFLTPLELHLPGIVPKAAQFAHFQIILPHKWTDRNKPVCIHLAGTGDHYFWRRRNLIVKPLLKMANIGAIIIENPFYGFRKPHNQIRSSLLNVSDIFVMGGCLILECLVLLHWCERNGFGPLGITGLSMGGHMASLAATNWPKPLVLVPCLSWSTAATVFTTGVMSRSINWDTLEAQYYADGKYYEHLSKMMTVNNDAFMAEKSFMKNFNESLIELKEDEQFSKSFPSSVDSKLSHNKHADNFNELTFINKLITLMNVIFTRNHSVDKQLNISSWFKSETLQFMRGIMDECTHLRNFSVPYDTSLVIALCAKQDAYVPREGCSGLQDIWPGVEVRYMDAGHVSAYILHQKLYRSCIIEAFEKAKMSKEIKGKQIVVQIPFTKLSYQKLMQNYIKRYP